MVPVFVLNPEFIKISAKTSFFVRLMAFLVNGGGCSKIPTFWTKLFSFGGVSRNATHICLKYCHCEESLWAIM